MVNDNAQIVIGNIATEVATQTALSLPTQASFCSDSEGWGPISPIRFDFTPCFLDVWVLYVAVWGVFFGAGALWYLLMKKAAQPIPKNWHFHAKLVSKQHDFAGHAVFFREFIKW
jgi:ATP-binding cassette, subfamily C (CFTR/MRP), member 1